MRAGRWHVVRAKVRFLQALAQFHRTNSGAGYPPTDDPQAKMIAAAIDPKVDALMAGPTSYVDARLKEVLADLPADWETRAVESGARGPAVTKFSRNVLGR